MRPNIPEKPCANQEHNLSSKLIVQSLTKYCNLRCAYCHGSTDNQYDQLGQKSEHGYLPPDAWSQLENFYYTEKARKILLTGGEPLMYVYLSPFLEFLQDKSIKYTLHTNGLGTKRNEFINFVEHKCTAYPDLHLSVELTDELQLAIRKRKIPYSLINWGVNFGLSIELKIVLSQPIVSYVDVFEDLLLKWLDMGIQTIRFQPVVPFNKQIDPSLILNASFVHVVEKIVNIKIRNTHLDRAIRNSFDWCEALISLLLGKRPNESIVNKCNIVNKTIFMTTDLTILNCKTLWNRSESLSCSQLFDLTCCCALQ